jgi:hypothetical protein
MLGRIFARLWSSIFVPEEIIMMRMGLIVVGLSTLAVVGELGTPSHTKTSSPHPFEQLTVEVGLSQDTLETADRLEIYHLQHEEPLHPVSPVELTPSPDVTALVSGDSSTVGLGANDKKGVVRKPKPRPKYTEPNKPRPKRTNANKDPKTEGSKAIVEVKPCRPNAFDSLLQALNLSSRCQT